jgi:hypothetical protein
MYRWKISPDFEAFLNAAGSQDTNSARTNEADPESEATVEEEVI